jgi:cytochrome c oxidase assembly factor 3
MSTSDRLARATYHPHGYGVSEGLARARRPFRTANVLTGGVIAGFAFSVYIYSIRAVKQDDFSDIDMPALPAGTLTIEEEERAKVARKAEMQEGFGLSATTPTPVQAAAAAAAGLTQATKAKVEEVVVGDRVFGDQDNNVEQVEQFAAGMYARLFGGKPGPAPTVEKK